MSATPPAVEVSRRSALRLGACSLLALAAAAACGGAPATPANAPPRSSSPQDRDLRLVTNAISEEERLGGFCAEAARRFPDQRRTLTALAARQRLHVARLRSTLSDLNPPVDHISPPVPRRAAALEITLGALVKEARTARFQDAQRASSGLLAELFASIAASHAQTDYLVTPQSAVITVTVPDTVDSAEQLQSALAAEHAAVYGYSLLGGVLSAAVSDDPLARTALASYNAHRARRDDLTGLIALAGGQPVASAAAYDIPFPVSGATSARRLARYLESRCAAVYARAVAVTSGTDRVFVSDCLLGCAVRGVRWGAAPSAFPGLETR